MASGGFSAGLTETRDPLDSSVEFLASQHYMVKQGGITLDASLFTADADGNKVVAGGAALGKVDATGKYGPVDAAATDGRASAKGLLFAGDVNVASGDVVCGLLIHGSVIEARCTGITDAVRTALADRILFQ